MKNEKLKIVALFLAVVGLVFILSDKADAIPFSFTIDWDPDVDFWDGYSYTQILNLVPSGLSLDSTALEIKHFGNRDSNNEMWNIESAANTYVGKLGNSESSWLIDTFILDEDIRSEIMDTTPWSLGIHLYETTSYRDKLKLDYSKIYGEYTPISDSTAPTDMPSVPEPALLSLLSMGLFGLLSFSYKRRL